MVPLSRTTKFLTVNFIHEQKGKESLDAKLNRETDSLGQEED